MIFFCVCKNWVEAQISLSQSSWLMSNLAFSRQLWRWVSFSKILPSLIFIVVLISRNKFFFFALLWEAKLSRTPVKDATRWWGLELQMKIGSSTRFEEIDTDIGTCFLIQVVVFVSLKSSSWTQIDSRSNIAFFFNSFYSLVYLIPNESSLSKRVSRIWYTFPG